MRWCHWVVSAFLLFVWSGTCLADISYSITTMEKTRGAGQYTYVVEGSWDPLERREKMKFVQLVLFGKKGVLLKKEKAVLDRSQRTFSVTTTAENAIGCKLRFKVKSLKGGGYSIYATSQGYRFPN